MKNRSPFQLFLILPNKLRGSSRDDDSSLNICEHVDLQGKVNNNFKTLITKLDSQLQINSDTTKSIS